MAVSNNYEIKNYILDGIVTQFAIPFDVNVDDYGNAINIVVYLGLDELEKDVDYTISVKTINYPGAVDHAGEKLTVFRRTPIEQPVDFVDNGNFTLEDIETGLDRSIMIEQETSANVDTTIRAQESAERAEQYKNIAIEKASDAEDWAVGTRSDGQTPSHSLESAKHYAESADTSASMATSMRNQSAANALVSEGYAKGTQGGVPVESGDYYQDNSKYYKEQAGLSAGAASGSATSAYNSELAAAASEDKAHDWADKATDSEVEPGEYSAKHWASKASQSSGSAAVSAYNAGLSETAAGTSETNAGNSATAAGASALKSEGFAVGEQNGTPVSSGSPYYHNSSKYYHDLITQIISGAMRYQGTWTTTGATDYSSLTTPRLKGDMFYCQGSAATIDGVTYTQGDLIIFNQDVADGTTITTAMIDKIDNTETVTPDNLITLTSKTIDAKDNVIKSTPTTYTTNTNLSPTKEMIVLMQGSGLVLRLGTAPYAGYVLPVCAVGSSYIVYKNSYTDTNVCLHIGSNKEIRIVSAGGDRWFLEEGTTLNVYGDIVSGAPDSLLPNDWRTVYGIGNYEFFYEWNNAATTYNLPTNFCSVITAIQSPGRGTAICTQWAFTNAPCLQWIIGNHDGWAPTWTEVTTSNGTQTLTNKTIDAKDNTILSTPTVVIESTTINFTKETHIIDETGVTITLGAAPYSGYIAQVTCRAGFTDVVYYNIAGAKVAMRLAVGQAVVFVCNYSGGNWNVVEAPVLQTSTNITVDGVQANDWRQFYGTAPMQFQYLYSSTSDYGTPDGLVNVQVMGTGSYRTAQAVKLTDVTKPSVLWTNKCDNSIWGNWTRFDGTAGGSGTVHDITSTAGSDFSFTGGGSLKYIVQNGVCYLSINGMTNATTGSDKTVSTAVPKSKAVYVGIEYFGNTFYVESGTSTLKMYADTTRVHYCSFSYPVADDWVES